MLTVGIDEVGYGPRLGPLVVAAAASQGPLGARVPIADSKKIFSQARGVGSLEPAVLGYVPAATFGELVAKLGGRLSEDPWYREPLPLPRVEPAGRLEAALARGVEPAELNEAVRTRNKADFLFEVAAGLVNRIRREHEGPIRFLVGKQGGRRFYRQGIARHISPEVSVVEETRGRSTYGIPGATISFLQDAEDRHELVALASMIGKYVRECAMKLFNDWWTSRLGGLRRTAGYGTDGARFFREIEPALGPHRIPRESVLRLR